MSSDYIFISHASADDAFITELRKALESQGLPVWVDSRNLRGGDKLKSKIRKAIETARHVIVVLSTSTINSPWVRKEIRLAEEVAKQRDDGYRVVPLLLPGVKPEALELWFQEEPVAVPIYLAPGGLSEALPAILAALGERAPDDRQPLQSIEAVPVEELILKLSDPEIREETDKHRVVAVAKLIYQPAAWPRSPTVESPRYQFTAPLGPIEAKDLRWYLESYFIWPTGVFRERARSIEKQFSKWGRALFQAALGGEVAREALEAWRRADGDAERRFSVLVDPEPPIGEAESQQKAFKEAVSALLSLPWELLHDNADFLCRGGNPVRVRRRLPNRKHQPPLLSTVLIRVLLVSPRPEDKYTSYIDHRISALPLVEAVEKLGKLVELTVLTPPTFPALQRALDDARRAKQPFDVVHFDGHGVYDREHGLGALCFEDPKDVHRLEQRAMQLIDARKLAGIMRDHRIPLVFLEACQSARVEVDPTASMAACLLEQGVTSIVAMSHSVLVETARRFVTVFYEELAQGSRIGRAMLVGQQALLNDSFRMKVMGAGDLRLQDWFVPVLYQEEQDPQLVTKLVPGEVRALEKEGRRPSLGDLPAVPAHQFVGRSRELLKLERLLGLQPYAVIRGQGGSGKTTLAVELARWLVRSGRFGQVSFISVEHSTEIRAVLDALGRQLVPRWSVAQYKNEKEAMQPVLRALWDRATLILLDNLESVLPEPGAETAVFPVEELFALCRELLAASDKTRLLFTSREPLPNVLPFDKGERAVINLGPLSREDAKELVGRVMANEGLEPAAEDPGGTAQEITDLVEAVNCHARALVLLAREVARQGVKSTTGELHRLMVELDRRYPGDRENSLYASVELSLRRLSPETRRRCRVLGVFRGGVHLSVLAHILEGNLEEARNLAVELIHVGLAGEAGDGHLHLEPALPSYMRREMIPEEIENAETGWAEGMEALLGLLDQQWSQNTDLAYRLIRLELPNLLALLERLEKTAPAERVVDFATTLEHLLQFLGLSRALDRVVAARKAAARGLQRWSHIGFKAEQARIERLLETGDLRAALSAAEALLQRCLAAGEDIYSGAVYDIGMAHWLFGRVLNREGAAEAGLQLLFEAQRRFRILANTDDLPDTKRMDSLSITENADCLMRLGHLDAAAAAYEEGIRQAEERNDARSIAVNKCQLGTVRILQQRYADALMIYHEVRKRFKALGEPGSVATVWHQIGIVHRKAGQFDQAEEAYQRSLVIEVQQNNRAGEASSLGELGSLYQAMDRLEESARFLQQAVDIYVELQNRFSEGGNRNNLAITLIKLNRFDEARRELYWAIECKKPYGYAAEPWATRAILNYLETAAGNPQAAAEARREAIGLFLAYRRDGGENHTDGARLCTLVGKGIRTGNTAEAVSMLDEWAGRVDLTDQYKALIPKLQAVLAGERDPALVDDPSLFFMDAVELRLLLEGLKGRS